jgi:hypothetical protein
MTASEAQRLRDYFETGFRDLQLADIKHADAADVRMGTFQLCAAFLDALSLAYSAYVVPKLRESDKWDRFVRQFFDLPRYDALVGGYGGFRCLLLHNFSASGLAFIHAHAESHLTTRGGLTVLNRETFVVDVERVFNKFYAETKSDAELRSRVLRYLDKHQPVGVWFLPAPQFGSTPVATAAIPPHAGLRLPPGYLVPLSASPPPGTLSFASSAATAVSGTGGDGWERAPIDVDAPRAPRLAPSIKQRPKKKRKH